MTAINKKLFLEGRLGTSVCLYSIWRFSNTFLFPKSDVVELGLLIKVFADFCSHAVMFWRFVICLGASWCGKVMTFSSNLPKWGRKILVKNLLWKVRKCLISKRGRRVNYLKGVQTIFGENGTLYICGIINN